jgi:hypothetical protein
MIDPARLHPMRVARGIRRRLIALVNPPRSESEEEQEEVVSTEDIASTIVRRTFEQYAGRVENPRLSVIFTDRPDYRRDATYHRDGAGYVLEIKTGEEETRLIKKAWELGPTYLYWLMQCPLEVKSLSVTLSDGDAPSGARFSPSTNRSCIVPIPDPYFFRYTGFRDIRDLAERDLIAWEDRSGDIVWRGDSSGHGTFDPVLGGEQPKMAAQRLDLILAAQKIPGVDVALSIYRRNELRTELLVQAGFLKDPIPEESWARRKFAIDVDGQTNTWSNMFIRMLLGCCVLKLDSKYNFRQWYYDRLRAWEHFVPVKADASDLGEKIEWLRSNDAEASRIADNGRLFMQAMTFEVGQREAVELITNHWRG